MGIKIRSARGEIVDLDLLRIKEQISAAPTPIDVQRRSNFIERKLRRRLKKTSVETADLIDVEPSFGQPDQIEDDIVEDKDGMVGDELATLSDVTTPQTEQPQEQTKTTKQRARREQ